MTLQEEQNLKAFIEHNTRMEKMSQMETLKKMDPAVLDRLKNYEEHRNLKMEGEMIGRALQQAITETVQRLASVIINERREEIEAACNFGELRDVLAAELARQFMASRLMGQLVPGDAKSAAPAGYHAGNAGQGQVSMGQQAMQRSKP